MPLVDNRKKQPRAVLAGLQLPDVSDLEHEASLDELERLVKTLGFVTVGRVSQKRKHPTASAIFGEGKLKELAAWTGGTGVVPGFKKKQEVEEEEEGGAELGEPEEEPALASEENGLRSKAPEGEKASVVVLDCELTPTQLSNLEKATGVEVLDRSGVILEIFSRHAQSREARLQVEIAKLNYLAPRLRVSHVGGDRQGGGIGAKGAGETTHELDRRRIRDRIAELRLQLQSIRTEQQNRRSLRQTIPLVALIGYTNAGKSSLMRQLTRANVEGEDKLFATLDTTVRLLQPEATPRILISDTVGFIKKLPHDLVASFRSTLDEAMSAALLLFIVDGADPNFRSQLQVTQEVIKELGADQRPARLIINKIDLLEACQRDALREEFPETLFTCAQNPEDMEQVRRTILHFFEKGMSDRDILVPYTQGQALAQIRARARVLKETFDENGTWVTVRTHAEVHNWIQKQLQTP